MEITKVKLNQSGLKGLEVLYSENVEKDGIGFINECTAKYSAPVQRKLKMAMQRLKYHMIRIYTLNTVEFDKMIDKKDFSLMILKEGDKSFNEYARAKKLMESLEITGVSSTGDNFLITGKMKTIGELVIGMATPKIDEGAVYPYFDEVMENVAEIFDETKIYISEDTKIDRKQLVFDFYKDNAEQLAALEGGSEEDLMTKAQEIIEKLGGVVLMPDTGEAELSEVVFN